MLVQETKTKKITKAELETKATNMVSLELTKN